MAEHEVEAELAPEQVAAPETNAGSERAERLDELLDDAPATDHHLGRFAGYRAGDRVRRRIAIIMGAAAVAAVVTYRQYVYWQDYARYHPFELSEEAKAEGRPREMHWSGGRARLGLSREAPGIEVIHLPDRRVELASGSKRAQIKLETVDGQTHITVLTGEIVQYDLDGNVIE